MIFLLFLTIGYGCESDIQPYKRQDSSNLAILWDLQTSILNSDASLRLGVVRLLTKKKFAYTENPKKTMLKVEKWVGNITGESIPSMWVYT